MANKISIAALLSYVTILFNIVIGIIFTPFIVKQIGKADYGLYVLVTSFLSYIVLDFGIGQVVSKLISKYRHEGSQEKIDDLIGIATRVYLIIDGIILSGLIIFYFFIEIVFGNFSEIELEKFKLIYILSCCFSVVAFPFTQLNPILISHEKFYFLKLVDLFSKLFYVVLLVTAFYLGGKLFSLVLSNIVVNLTLILVKYIYIQRNLNVKINLLANDKTLIREILNLSFWVTVVIISQVLLNNIAPTLLGILSRPESIAIFAIGMTVAGYVWTLSTALSGLFVPSVTKLYTNEDRNSKITDLMIQVGRIQLFIVGILIIGFITLGKEFIYLWVGQDFDESYYVAVIMMVPYIILTTQEIGSTYLLVANKIKTHSLVLLIGSILNIILAFIIIPTFGPLGSAVSIFISVLLSQVIGMNFIYWKVEKLNIPYFFKECHLKLMIPLVLSLLSGFLIQIYIPSQSLVGLIPKVLLLSFLHCVFMWYFGINKYEKQMILNFSNKIFKIS